MQPTMTDLRVRASRCECTKGGRVTNICVKLTDAQGRTHNNTVWVPGQWNPAGVRSGVGGLCGSGFYHAYDYADIPEVAYFLNPLGANFASPRLWFAEWRGTRANDGCLKFGATAMRVLEEYTAPRPTLTQHVAFAVLVAETVADLWPSDGWRRWAEGWLSGQDRSDASAASAASAAWDASAASAAWDASAASAAWAAERAASAASAASDASAAWAASAASDAWDASAASAASAARFRDTLAECAAWAMTLGAEDSCNRP